MMSFVAVAIRDRLFHNVEAPKSVPERHKIRRSLDLEALKLWKGRSVTPVADATAANHISRLAEFLCFSCCYCYKAAALYLILTGWVEKGKNNRREEISLLFFSFFPLGALLTNFCFHFMNSKCPFFLWQEPQRRLGKRVSNMKLYCKCH